MTAGNGLDIARRVKALRIALAIRKLGGGAHEARQFSDSDWINAAKLSAQQTGRGYPKRGETWHVSEVTRALVEDDIEEVATRLSLRKDILSLHIDFFTAVAP